MQELLREQEREFTGRIRELEKEAETSAALSQRVSKALVSRLVAKDNALRAIKVQHLRSPAIFILTSAELPNPLLVAR